MSPWKDELIKKYFFKQYVYNTILHMLMEKHNISMSMRNLKRVLQRLNLKRKNIEESPVDNIAIAIQMELDGSGANLGYRAMCNRLKNSYHLTVKQETVRRILKIIDPDGVDGRARHRLKRRVYSVAGPNMLWHCDGHDKLCRYGFSIYGCIDGYSKKIMLLKISSTNKDREVILYYYVQTIRKLGFLPTRIRTDKGTEVVLMQDVHMALRANHTDALAGRKSFIKGPSTHNQRIECYWNLFEKHLGQFYMNLFRQMEHEGMLDVSIPFHKEALRYSFGKLIQDDIERSRKEWNQHRIRKQNNVNFGGGIPNVRYNWPEKFGGHDCRKSLNLEHLRILEEDYANTIPTIFNQTTQEMVSLLLPYHQTPRSAEEAFNLFMEVIAAYEVYLQRLEDVH